MALDTGTLYGDLTPESRANGVPVVARRPAGRDQIDVADPGAAHA
ncbi:hypothetical protein [Phaeovulum sp. NW3]|nr:hypothetical protein [Phaeovulum sp. NW3]